MISINRKNVQAKEEEILKFDSAFDDAGTASSVLTGDLVTLFGELTKKQNLKYVDFLLNEIKNENSDFWKMVEDYSKGELDVKFLNSLDSEVAKETALDYIAPKNNLVINIFGAPGVGKTTLALNLKEYLNSDALGYHSAIIPEYAQELIDSGKIDMLSNQIEVTGQQIACTKGILKLYSNLAIAESPVELGRVYNRDYTKANELTDMIEECNEHYKSINLFMSHTDSSKADYNTNGRVHNLEKSLSIEEEMKSLFWDKNLIFINRDMDVEEIFDKIQETQIWKDFEKIDMEISEKVKENPQDAISIDASGKIKMSSEKADKLIASMTKSNLKNIER